VVDDEGQKEFEGYAEGEKELDEGDGDREKKLDKEG